MKIAYFTDTYLPQINGVTNTLKRLQHYLDKREDIEYLIFAPDYGAKELTDTRINQYLSFKLVFYPACRLSIPNPIKTNIILDAFKPDLIHCITEINTGITGIRYAQTRNLPLITTFTTDFPNYLKYFEFDFLEKGSWNYMKWVHNSGDLCVCPSTETKKYLEQNGVKNVGIWGRGIDYDHFKPVENDQDKVKLKKKYGIDPDQIALLFVGRISPEKNLDVLVKAYKRLKEKQGHKIKLIMVGDGPMTETLKKEVDSAVIFTGYQTGEALKEYYALSDIFVFPSTTETLGNVVLEAMASGLPVVGARAGGVKDNIIHGYNGLLTPPSDSEKFYDNIDKLIEFSVMRDEMALNARQFAKQKSWQCVFDDLMTTYQTVVKSNTKRVSEKIS